MIRRWIGVKALVHDGVDAVVELVREGHESTSRSVLRVTDQIEPLRRPARLADTIRRVATDGVLGTVKFVNRTVEAATDAGLDMADASSAEHAPPVPMTSEVTGSLEWFGDAALALVNGAVGDHLNATDSTLDLQMVFRIDDTYVDLTPESLAEALPNATDKVAIFVHGLGASEWSWCLESEAYHGDAKLNFGALLQRDLGFTPIFVRYNTGRHVTDNGRLLAKKLIELVQAYPVSIRELTLLGHSMGGLVVRSAGLQAEQNEEPWTNLVKRVFYLGSPHRGAPLAKLGHVAAGVLGAIDLPSTRILSRIIDGRSDGVKDLRHGGLTSEEWESWQPLADREHLPLTRAAHYFLSGSVTHDPDHLVSRIVGDLMVQRPSAAGPIRRGSAFDINTSHYGGILHHQLQNHPAVYREILKACTN